MRKSLLLLTTAAALLLIALGPASLMPVSVHAAPPVDQGTVIPFHPVNPNYWTIKAEIDAHAPLTGTGTSPAPSFPPTTFVSQAGIPQSGYTPGDSNGAIGPTEYIETINESVGVYDRSLNQLSTNRFSNWSGSNCSTGDPVIMYSAADQRYYVTCIGSTNLLGWGFSKTNAPSANSSDWCFYSSNFNGRYGGSTLPDYPKLGDTTDFVLIGVNVFQSFSYVGSDVAWVSKPAKGVITTCPDISQLKLGTVQNLLNKDGTQAATPNPMKQADPNSTGYVMANEDPNGGSSTHLTAYTVTNSGGSAVLSSPIDIVVPGYQYPPSAPQQGSNAKFDTLDARLMSGWMWKDPAGKWHAATGHTVAASKGGLGAEFRWYVVTPGAALVKGVVHDPNLYVFMGAVSPDRNAVAGKFGTNLLMFFNTSSLNTYIAVAMATYSGKAKQLSSIVPVYTSTVPYTGCLSVCRWGDYSGASPDPASTSAGQVWGTLMESQGVTWGTWNFGATP